MKHSVSYYIREQLRESRTVYIPGLGEFKLIQHPARISSLGNTIQPPTLSLEFSDSVGNELPLLHRMSTVEEFSLEKAKKKLTKFSNNIFNKLINLNKVDIKGLGTLVRQSDKLIKFVDTVDDLTDEYRGLKTLSLQEVRYVPSQSQASSVGIAAANVINSDQVFEPVRNTSDTIAKTNQRNWWIPVIVGILIALAYVFAMKVSKGNSIGIHENDVILNSLTNGAECDEVVSVEDETTAVLQQIIIVGTFSNRANVDQMLSKIEQLGYTSYTSDYKGMTRVGVQSTSAEEDLSEIQNNLSRQAWLLEE